MKWLKVITIGLVLLVLSSSLGFSTDVPDFYPISGCQKLTDREWHLVFLGVTDTSYPFYKGLKTWTETRYEYVEKSLWFDIFGMFGSQSYRVLAHKEIHQYDNDGLETECYRYSKGGPDSIISTDQESKETYECQYNDQGRLIAELLYGDGVLSRKTIIGYDQRGNKSTHIVCYGPNAKKSFGWSYKNNETGTEIETIHFWYRDGRKVKPKKSIHKFDEQGRRIEAITYEKDCKTVKSRQTHEYDDEKNEEQIRTYNANGKLTSTQNYKYDHLGNTIGGGYRYKYDQKGNLLERAWQNEKGQLYGKRTYKYDDKSNLIERNDYEIIQQDDKDIAIIKEQIIHKYEFYPEDKEPEEPEKK